MPYSLFGPLTYRNDKFPYPLYISVGEIKSLPFHAAGSLKSESRYSFRAPRDEGGKTDCTVFAGFRVKVRELSLFQNDVHSNEF